MLSDARLVYAVADQDVRHDALVAELEHAGAIVHRAFGETEAIALYSSLTAQRLVPRALITSWQMDDIGRLRRDLARSIRERNSPTAEFLISIARGVDPNCAVVVLGGERAGVRPSHLDVEWFEMGQPTGALTFRVITALNAVHQAAGAPMHARPVIQSYSLRTSTAG